MRLTSALVLSTLCWSFQSAGASIAHVYTYDPPSRPRANAQSRSLSPVEARLVLAQRAGVEDYHSSDLASEGVISAINDFGVRTPLFADEKSDVKRAFILFEGETSSEGPTSSLQSFSSFQLSPAPDAASSHGLFVDLARQSDPSSFLKLSDADLSTLLRTRRTKSSNGDLFYLAKSTSDPDTDALIARLVDSEQWSLTALVVPSQTSDAKDDTFTWGTYTMPGSQSLLRRQSTDAPLSSPQVESSTSSFSAPVNALQDDNTSPAPSPFKGIVPACYSTQNACETGTRSCTGHGSCKLKFYDADLKQNCFACACVPSKDGQRTTYWGGPACQKKDISVEFWLISLFTVGLVGLVSFAVGAVWEMGSEQLPSVIGAGVSGTGARK